MEEWGNGRTNEYYEASVPSHVYRPKEGDTVRTVEKYIRDKYEFKRYIAKSIPPKVEREDAEEEEEDEAPRRRTTKSRAAPVVKVAPAAPAPAPAPAPVPVAAPSLIGNVRSG